MKLHIYKDADEVIKAVADLFVQTVNAAIDAKAVCNVVLSGGNSPKKLYQLLASEVYSKKVNWNSIYFFFGDERYVPFADENNNGRMAKEILFEQLHIDEAKVFYVDTSLQPDEAATDYTNRILHHFSSEPVQFDLILLGLGDNTHTASLFPHTEVLYEMKPVVYSLFVEELQAYRITMTAPLINQAHNIAFLVYGNAKAQAVYNILKTGKNIDEYPGQLIQSKDGTTYWFMDEAAAALLDN
jgi:6-phosphogluconolactonase